jgi:DNA-binding transcriptional regulator YdaS (Cro superfamily)
MDIAQYLSSPGAMSVADLRLRMRALGYEVKSNAQIRQWRTGFRSPSEKNCAGLEMATDGRIRRQDLRPNDWWLIWPEMPGAKKRSIKKK